MHHIRHPVKEKSTAVCGRCDLTQSQEETVRMDVQSLGKRERDTQSWILEAPNNSVCGLHFQLSSLLVFRERLASRPVTLVCFYGEARCEE